MVPLSIGYFSAGVASAARHLKPGWRNRSLWLSSREAGELVLVGFATVVMALLLVLSKSLAGVMCFAFVLVALGWVAVGRHTTTSRRLLAASHSVAVLIVAAVWAGIDTVGQEFHDYRYSTVSGRVDVWRDIGQIVQDFPLTGTGPKSRSAADRYCSVCSCSVTRRSSSSLRPSRCITRAGVNDPTTRRLLPQTRHPAETGARPSAVFARKQTRGDGRCDVREVLAVRRPGGISVPVGRYGSCH